MKSSIFQTTYLRAFPLPFSCKNGSGFEKRQKWGILEEVRSWEVTLLMANLLNWQINKKPGVIVSEDGSVRTRNEGKELTTRFFFSNFQKKRSTRTHFHYVRFKTKS
jgi:hypothetical protein